MNETTWQSYEEVATHLLNQIASELGLQRVEGKQSVAGLLSGTTWAIDAKGIKSGEEGFVIVECRRRITSRQKQEDVAALAFRIADTGAAGAIVVSPLGLQEGAAKIARATNIVDVRMDANSTAHSYMVQFLNKVFVGVTDKAQVTESATVVVVRVEDQAPS